MARKAARPEPDFETTLRKNCPECGCRMWVVYDNGRTIMSLTGLVRLTLKVRRCHNEECSRHLTPYRPEAEVCYALPQHEFGLAVVALIGTLRHISIRQ